MSSLIREPLSTTTPSGPSHLSSNADVLRDVCRQSSVLQHEIVMKPHEDRPLRSFQWARRGHQAPHVEVREAEATIMVQSSFSS